MTDRFPPPFPRRILAAFHPSTGSRLAIEGAVDLAFRLRAELSAMFIEDASLLDLSEYPFLRQIGAQGAIARPRERKAVESELRAFARQAERHLAETAARQHVRWSFTTARGRIEDQIKTLGAIDLLIVESSSRPIGRVMQLEASTRMLAKLTGGSVLLIHPTQRLAGPVHAIVEAEGDAAKVTTAAAELADRFESALSIHLVAVDKAASDSLNAIIQSQLTTAATHAAIENLTVVNREELKRILELSRGGVLVLSADSPLLNDDAAWTVIAKAPCAVLLAR